MELRQRPAPKPVEAYKRALTRSGARTEVAVEPSAGAVVPGPACRSQH